MKSISDKLSEVLIQNIKEIQNLYIKYSEGFEFNLLKEAENLINKTIDIINDNTEKP